LHEPLKVKVNTIQIFVYLYATNKSVELHSDVQSKIWILT